MTNNVTANNLPIVQYMVNGIHWDFWDSLPEWYKVMVLKKGSQSNWNWTESV